MRRPGGVDSKPELWSVGHQVIEGNGKADEIAKKSDYEGIDWDLNAYENTLRLRDLNDDDEDEDFRPPISKAQNGQSGTKQYNCDTNGHQASIPNAPQCTSTYAVAPEGD